MTKRTPKENQSRKALIKDMFPDMEVSEHGLKQMEHCFDEFLTLALEDDDEEEGLESPDVS